ncbi:hypothetical protein [Dankookia sp. P2]|uniref:hypothetical protein n=1 Tax=Dankookia sp. P2 TaxID=3423955 RepID=UPI003D67FEDE
MPTPNRRIRTLAAGALALALGTTALTPFVFPAEAQPRHICDGHRHRPAPPGRPGLRRPCGPGRPGGGSA